jgi:hypothetical protein
MKKIVCLVVLTVTALVLCTGVQAATTLWFGDPNTGAVYGSDIYTPGELAVDSGNTFELGVWCATTELHNCVEIFAGFDASSATTFGAVGSGTTGDLTLTSTTSQINATINPLYGMVPTVLGSARESNNTYIGGRPYGIDMIGCTGDAGYVPQGNVRFFNFTLQNNMSRGEYAWVVISDAGSGTVWTSSLVKDTSLYRDGYALKIVTAPEPSSLLALIAGSAVVGGCAFRRYKK